MQPDPAERLARIREHMTREGAKRPTGLDANGYGPGQQAGWHVDADAPNVTGHPAAAKTPTTEAFARGEAVDAATILAAHAGADPDQTTPPAARTGPAPDPSQGAHGATVEPNIDQQIEAARARGDHRAALALQLDRQRAKLPRRFGGTATEQF